MTKIEQQTMDAIIGIYREMKRAKDIDWEQRRFEVAKEMFREAVAYNRDIARELNSQMVCIEDCAKLAVRRADILISELKKGS